MEKKLSYLSIEPHLKRLQCTGFYPLSGETSKLLMHFHTVYMHFSLILTPIYVTQEFIKVFQVRDDVNKLADTMFLLLTNSDIIYKQVVFRMHADKINSVVDIMKGPIFNQGNKEHEVLLSQTMRFSYMFLRAFNYTAFATCILWFVYPMYLFDQNGPVEFAIWLPSDANKFPYFYFALVYIWVQTSWQAFNNTTMDAFISFCLAQSKTQLSILRLELECLVLKSKQESKRFSQPYEKVLQRRFRKIVLHYNEIVNYTNNLLSIFGGALLYQFMVSGWIICITAYRTLKINPASVEFASMNMYLCCIIAEIFMFCHFGDEVYWESKRVLESAYIMDWLELPVKIRKELIIFMERLKRPLMPRAGAFIPLSNGTFVSIMRSSYSFYALLKNTT